MNQLFSLAKKAVESALLAYDSVDICYGATPVVQDVSFSIRAGEILGIIGESGSGKSTLLKAALGILGPSGVVTKGSIWSQSRNLTDMPPKERQKIAGAEIGFVFQDAASHLCPVRTIGSQAFEAMNAHKRLKKSQTDERMLDLLDKLSFTEGKRILNSYPFELSGGMSQRIGIAMAMLMNPPLIFADEPTSALDATTQKQILKEMLLLREQYGTAIAIATHNIGVISAMTDWIMVLDQGIVKEYGKTHQVLTSPQSAYTKKFMSAVPKLRRA